MMRRSGGKKALVLGSGSRAFLSVVRSLGRSGVQVHVAWHQVHDPALRSRYVTKAHTLPPYDAQSDAWKVAFITLLQNEQFDLVLPCDDPTLIPLQKNRRVLEPYARLYLLSDRAFDVVSDKFKTAELARAVGVPAPRETVIRYRHESANVGATFSLPLVLKPRASFDPEDLSGKRVVRKAYSWDDFDRCLEEMLPFGPVAVQENVPGVGVGLELLLQAGEPLLAFQHMRIHEPLHGGGSSYRKGVAVSPHLLTAACALLSPLAYTGVAMVEFKVDVATGAWWLMEINGRFWGSLPLAIASGVDFPLALFQLLVEGRTNFPQSYRVGLYCRNLSLDMEWQRANLRAQRTHLELFTRSLGSVVAETVIHTLTLRERSDTFTHDDWAPGFTEIGQVLAITWVALRSKVMRKILQMKIVRWWLARQALAALHPGCTVLFVCKGNICRSPFAELLARQWCGVATIFQSGGYLPREDRPAPEAAIQSARQWSVDLSAHRSRSLTPGQLGMADTIIVFDYENYRYLIAHYGVSRERIHFIGALRPSGPLFIDDPWGKQSSSFDATYRYIADALSAIIGRTNPTANGTLSHLGGGSALT